MSKGMFLVDKRVTGRQLQVRASRIKFERSWAHCQKVQRSVEACALRDRDDLRPEGLNTQIILVLSSLIDDAFAILEQFSQREVSDFCYAVERIAVGPIPAL
eukprot:12053197-Karenia_brevis.AAC.1